MKSAVKDIKSAIRKLSHHDLAELRAWFSEFDADAWDRQSEKDARNGRLDAFHRSFQHENEGQPDISLDKILDQGSVSDPTSPSTSP